MKLISSRRNAAFTLLEIMLVVAIIALLMGAGFMMLGNQFGYAQDVKLQADLQSFDGKLKSYEMMNGFLPTTEQGLQALVTQPTSEPKPTRWYQMMDRLPKDPWNRDYIYVCPGKHNPQSYDISSKGKDGIADTADDRGNWENKP